MKKDFIVMLLLTALILVACKTKEKEVEIEVIPESPLEMMQTSSNNFKKYWDAGAVDELTNEFTDDAIRVIGISQSPHIGKQEIKLSFQNELGEGNDLEGSHIEVTTDVVRKVSPNVLIGAGTWNILNSNNISLDNGKWGNIYEIKDGEIKFLMESAYSSKVVVKDSSSTPEIIKLNKYVGAGEENFEKIQESIVRYVAYYNAKDFDALSNEFTTDGIRTVSSSDTIAIGSAAIKSSLKNETLNQLEATIVGYRDLGNSIVIAHGQWNESDPSGALLAFGQWGNIFKIEDGQAKLLMESAGVFWSK